MLVSNAVSLKQSAFDSILSFHFLFTMSVSCPLCKTKFEHFIQDSSFLFFSSEMHQGHPCLFCREAPQGHAGTTAVSFHCNYHKPNVSRTAGGSRSRGEDFTAAVNEVSHCDVLTGSRDQGHNPHPHHGVPLRDRYAGHQTGLCEDLRKITVHSHLSKSH